MNSDIKLLCDIQKEDLEIRSLEEQLATLRNKVAECREKIAAHNEDKDKLAKSIAYLQEKMRLEENHVKEHQEAVDQLNEHIKEAKNLKEFNDLKHQVSNRTFQMKTVEDSVLQHMEEIEGEKAKISEIDEAISAVEKELATIEESIADEVAEYEKAIDEHRQVRNSKTTGLDPELLEEYERLFERYEGEAVTDVDGRTCNGCFMNLTANVEVMVQTSEEIVRCPSCRRLLVSGVTT